MRNKILNKFKSEGISIDIAFDVGANVGQSVKEFLDFNPKMKIFAFEPVAASYEVLCKQKWPANVAAFNVGLGAVRDKLHMTSIGTSTGNHVVSGNVNSNKVEISEFVRGSDFSNERNIDSIDFLKIDAEGFDLQVLIGFAEMFAMKKINYVHVECGFTRTNQSHIYFDTLSTFFEQFGYCLYSITGLTSRLGGKPKKSIQYGDVIFYPI